MFTNKSLLLVFLEILLISACSASFSQHPNALSENREPQETLLPDQDNLPPTSTSTVTSPFLPEPTASSNIGFSSNSIAPVVQAEVCTFEGGELAGDGLTPEQQSRLHQAAMNYVALTQEEATLKAQGLNYVQYASPSNMCGPLAIAILRDAGIVDPYVNLKDFWLIRPDQKPQVIERTLPSEQFEHFHFDIPLHQFDFQAFPLKAGDLLYLYAGAGGTFEHVLAVTRVDEAGRAYSVNNVNTSKDGYYVIQEVMLYDPQQPGMGYFYEWTNIQKNLWIGLTGFGGFDLWRPSQAIHSPSPQTKQLMASVDQVIQQAGGKWHIWIKDMNTQCTLYQRQANYKVHIASIVKVPIAMLVFAKLEQVGITESELAQHIQTQGYQGRTFAQLLQAMLIHSEETATQNLLDFLSQPGFNPDARLSEWGFSNTNLKTRISTAQEMGKILELLIQGGQVSAEARRIILTYMAEYTPSDETRLGAMKPYLSGNSQIFNKRASLANERVIVGDAGIVRLACETSQKEYAIVLLGYPAETPTTYEALEKALGDISVLLGQYIGCH
jgi:hypothetical protein